MADRSSRKASTLLLRPSALGLRSPGSTLRSFCNKARHCRYRAREQSPGGRTMRKTEGATISLIGLCLAALCFFAVPLRAQVLDETDIGRALKAGADNKFGSWIAECRA